MTLEIVSFLMFSLKNFSLTISLRKIIKAVIQNNVSFCFIKVQRCGLSRPKN